MANPLVENIGLMASARILSPQFLYDGSALERAWNIGGNLIFTNCLGPVFVKNPWWTEDILRDIVLQKHGVARGKAYDLESASFDSCLRFTDTKPEYPIS